MDIEYVRGQLPAEIEAEIHATHVEPPSLASQVHLYVAHIFISHGYYVRGEVQCAGGRVDLVATSPEGQMVAIEADCRRPKAKSLMKLRHFPALTALSVFQPK